MSLPPLDRKTLIISLEAVEIAKKLSVAAFSLNVWDIIICLDKEIKYFWTGPWTISRVLYLWNRYLAPFLTIFILICFFHPNLSDELCERGIKACFAVSVIGLGTVQLVLVLRIWYLFPHSHFVRSLCVLSFIVSNILSATFVGQSSSGVRSFQVHIPGLHTTGCAIPPPGDFWRSFIPALVLHTLLFVLTTLRAVKRSNASLKKNLNVFSPSLSLTLGLKEGLREAPLMRRILRDGGIFYFVVIVVVAITAACSFFTDQPKINIPAIYSGGLLVFCSIAISRLMLSIQSVASHLGPGHDESWVLTNVELSRGAWKMRKGSHDGEIIVDVECPGPDIDYDYGNEEDGIVLKTTTGTTNTNRNYLLGQGQGKGRGPGSFTLPRIDTSPMTLTSNTTSNTVNDTKSGSNGTAKGRSSKPSVGVRVTRVGYLEDPKGGPVSPLPTWQ